MDAKKAKTQQRKRRHRRVRKKIVGTESRPRLCVFRSARHIYAQIVDDTQGKTLAACSTLKAADVSAEEKVGKKIAAARDVGKQLAKIAKEKGIESVSFDRGGYRYHGRVAALANAARESGLKF